jgi:hypothetical protein
LALCGGIWAFAYVMVAAVFFSLIFSTLENNLKISLKKVCSYQNGRIFVSRKTVKQ